MGFASRNNFIFEGSWHFLNMFSETEIIVFWLKFYSSFLGFQLTVSQHSGNGLVPSERERLSLSAFLGTEEFGTKQWAIIWTNEDPIQWHKYVSSVLDE